MTWWTKNELNLVETIVIIKNFFSYFLKVYLKSGLDNK